VGPKSFQWEGVIKIWTRGQNFSSKIKVLGIAPKRTRGKKRRNDYLNDKVK
jgi:hypothetical protein